MPIPLENLHEGNHIIIMCPPPHVLLDAMRSASPAEPSLLVPPHPLHGRILRILAIQAPLLLVGHLLPTGHVRGPILCDYRYVLYATKVSKEFLHAYLQFSLLHPSSTPTPAPATSNLFFPPIAPSSESSPHT